MHNNNISSAANERKQQETSKDRDYNKIVCVV